jgi:hypothetical protein
MSTQNSAGFEIHVTSKAVLPSTLHIHNLEREPTCIEFCSVNGQACILAALWQIEHTSVCLYPVEPSGTGPALELRILAGDFSHSSPDPLLLKAVLRAAQGTDH